MKQTEDLHSMKMKVQQKLLQKAELEIQILRNAEKRNEEIHRIKIRESYN